MGSGFPHPSLSSAMDLKSRSGRRLVGTSTRDIQPLNVPDITWKMMEATAVSGN